MGTQAVPRLSLSINAFASLPMRSHFPIWRLTFLLVLCVLLMLEGRFDEGRRFGRGGDQEVGRTGSSEL